MNYVLGMFEENTMIASAIEQAATLASLALFLGIIAIWAQVIAIL